MIDRRDALTGGTLAATGIAMIVVALQFPVIGAMAYGPGLFPKIVASGLILSGIGIAAEGFANRRGESARIRPAPLLGLVAIIAGFAVALDPLGFHIASTVALVAAVKLFRGSWLTAVIFAPVSTVLLHMLFYNLLRVPLPWGILLPFAW